eukprot:c20726_g4_i2.p1 GENE.c20726_g4_i2~~c20726_g4_i2.p1  ORF type:complete len:113 (-),score=9.52 c20726_g4_i2:271-609(-)
MPRPHASIEQGRALRRMGRELCVGPAIDGREKAKYAHFRDNFVNPEGETEPNFRPFVLTAGGGVSKHTRDVLRTIAGKEDVRAKQLLACKFSVILLKWAVRMVACHGAIGFA